MLKINVPKGEILWETWWSSGKEAYVITSNKTRDTYYLYKVNGDSLVRITKAKTPQGLKP